MRRPYGTSADPAIHALATGIRATSAARNQSLDNEYGRNRYRRNGGGGALDTVGID